jgi:predicted outer membrane repeat protein
MSEDGGLFRIEGKVNFTDYSSTYEDNSGYEGGVISCSGCNLTMTRTKFKSNQARRGGVIKLEASGNLTTDLCSFTSNSAFELGGVIFVTT